MKVFKKCAAVLLSAAVLASTAIFSACGNVVQYVYPDSVSVYETTGTKSSLLSRKSSIAFEDFEGEDYTRQTINVSLDGYYQEYIGYGASMTHASAYLIMQADEETRTYLLNDLFSREGANFSVVRIPIGASDYIPGDEYFTCDDMPSGETDMELKYFNLDNDADIIAVCKIIQEINPDVVFMAAPWSAPAWMKTNEMLVGGGSLKDGMEEVYADYLVRFVAEYAEEGIEISMLSLLNEPSVGALSYPTMDVDAIEASVITAYVGQKLAEQGFDTDIVSWDYNYGSSYAGYADTYLEMLFEEYADTAGIYSSIVGFHGYDGDGYYSSDTLFGLRDGIEKVSVEYGKTSIITEITESASSNDFAANLTYASKNIVVNPCAAQTDYDGNAWNGCSGALYWNFVLDEDGEPTPASHGNACYGVITLESETRQGQTTYKYTKSSAYYAMAHISKFLYDVDGVACRALAATTDYADLNVLAFYCNDGAIIVVVCNTNETNNAPIDIVIGDKKISYTMMPQSMVTFVC